MKVKMVENTTESDIVVDLGTGLSITLKPGQVVENANVQNHVQLNESTRVVYNLNEVR